MIHRKVYNLDTAMIDDEYVTENHAIMMYQPLLETGQSEQKDRGVSVKEKLQGVNTK